MVNAVLRKYTDKKKERYFEEYQNSDLTISQFVREKRIPASTIRGWLDKKVDIRFKKAQSEENTRLALLFIKNTKT